MTLEFSFDEISLDQKVSREQLEIDLYDELVTISDAEPEEQVRLLAVKPAVPISPQDDKPESIRVTGSLGKEHSMTGTPFSTVPKVAQQTEAPIAARHDIVEKPEPLPLAIDARPGLPVTPLNGHKPNPVKPPAPSPRTKEIQPPAQAPAFAPSKNPEPSTPPRPAPSPVPTASAEPLAGECPDCGKPAGELDMICIECGAFIG